MIFYTPTGARSAYFGDHCFAHTSMSTFEPNSVYWYDQHDAAIKQRPFSAFLDQRHWDHLQNDRTSKILFFYGDEYFNLIDLQDWAETIIKRNINPEQVFIVCMDQNFVDWATRQLQKLRVNGVNITHCNVLLNKVTVHEPLPYEKRFSAFSRNYGSVNTTRPWRLYMYAKLFLNGTLDNFHYTFNTIHPYPYVGFYPEPDKSKIVEHLRNFDINITEPIKDWVEGMPYTIDREELRNKFSNDIYHMLQTSGVHLVIESHFDPFWNFSRHRSLVSPEKFSPAFPTEKLYKAVACSKPFIMFSTPFFLKELKQLGYRTFSPYINEDYDNIVDDVARANAIADEIKRLNDLPEDKFQEMLKYCEDACVHNLSVLQKELNTPLEFTGNFAWLNESFLPMAIRK